MTFQSFLTNNILPIFTNIINWCSVIINNLGMEQLYFFNYTLYGYNYCNNRNDKRNYKYNNK